MSREVNVDKSNGVLGWFRRRDVVIYPRGWLQIGLLVLVIIANVVANYEGELAPVVPILLPFLKLNLIDYGFIVGGTTVVSGIVAMLLGSRFDRYGRTVFIVLGTFITAIAVFAMVLVHNTLEFIIVRLIMAIVLGLVLPATTGLVRDFTPRVGRALGFGLWTFGPVGANFLAAGVAGWTLPIFHDRWQSQFYIMGTVCLVISIVVALFIRDLSPNLRAQIVRNHQDVRTAEKNASRVRGEIANPRLVFASFRIWSLAVGIVLFLLVYYFTTAFGPLYLATVFKYPPAKAAGIASYFWLANLASLIVVGVISDWLQLRKICSMIGVVGAIVFMFFWIHLIGHTVSVSTMIWYTSIQGVLLGIGFGPWMALYSETLEDIHPTLQGSGWALWSFAQYVIAGIAGGLTFVIVGGIGFAGFFYICMAGMFVYGIVLLGARGPWFKRGGMGLLTHSHASAQPGAGN
ncbi:MFS transporter [Alicyclobacillus sp. SP_1]|uniref:MFS transporter n=1 Tax=Alicyclobacillus sp. SP_1 TaxID=2942475 RepID=UPI0021580B47|nr:MFS transporter [Alicyclobacillus sp. SP_1]